MERYFWSPISKISDAVLDRANVVVGVLLVVAVVGFGAYYYQDRYSGQDKTLLTDRAIKNLEEAVRADPSNPGLRIAVAGAYMAAGRIKESIAQYEEALSVDSENQDALLGLGHLLYTSGKREESLAPYEQLAQLHRSNPVRLNEKALALAFYNLGTLYLGSGRFDEAVESFQETITLDNGDAEARYWLGEAYRRKGQWDKATVAYKDATRFVPNYKEAYQGLVDTYTAMGDKIMAAHARGMVSYSDKDYQSAIRQLGAVVRERPDFVDAHYGLGLAYEESGQLDNAASAFRQVLAIDPQNLWARGSLQRIGALEAKPVSQGSRGG
ncbi:MAG: Tetratricopeptide 1 repeat-containing protein [Dehalococcoidia bacterium]|nr:Tetratricopeptide 1 repeat-containing protein [Dehalococcoidia bacterium]